MRARLEIHENHPGFVNPESDALMAERLRERIARGDFGQEPEADEETDPMLRSIWTLDLEERTLSALERAGFVLVGEVAALPDWRLKRVPGMGPVQVCVLRSAVAKAAKT
jgi:DNA-directed RNA polymerase alpha subunit